MCFFSRTFDIYFFFYEQWIGFCDIGLTGKSLTFLKIVISTINKFIIIKHICKSTSTTIIDFDCV